MTLATDYYNTDITPFTINYPGNDPAEDPEIYLKTSPMKMARTPTLIQHGELDRRVPIANASELRQGLENRGVKVEMVVHKVFGHGINKPKSMRAVMQHNLSWFNHYVWGDLMPAALITCDWIRAHHNLHLTGPTGTGKSWLACALGQQACRQGLAVRYERVARLLETLRIARGDGSYHKRLATFAKTDLLILDDFGLKPLTQAERLDLLELIDDRHGRRFTLITSQLPIAHWHAYLGEDPTVADALLDRLLSAAHRLELKGESLRKRQKQNGKELDAERAKQ